MCNLSEPVSCYAGLKIWRRLHPCQQRKPCAKLKRGKSVCAVQGLLLQNPLGTCAADYSLPECGGVPVIRFVAQPDIGGLRAPSLHGGPEPKQPVEAQAGARGEQTTS